MCKARSWLNESLQISECNINKECVGLIILVMKSVSPYNNVIPYIKVYLSEILLNN